jgi:hypothetical protein
MRCSGPTTFITVIQAADNESVAHLSVELGSRGTVNIVTLPAISIAQLRAKLKGPKQMETLHTKVIWPTPFECRARYAPFFGPPP